MQKGKVLSEKSDKTLAAVCGLFCGACSWFIATTENPARLKKLAAQRRYTEEEGRCYGCRSDKRLPYCADCSLFACAEQQGIDFCSQCEAYPCADLKQFQSAMPHRIELWTNLERIKTVGYAQWLEEVRENYLCPQCRTINSTYDLQCRTCGEDPSCRYVAEHKPVIERYIQKNR
jgi:hypothetical protein